MYKIQSIEPNIAYLVNGWLKSYGLDYKLEQESLNEAKLLLQDVVIWADKKIRLSKQLIKR